MTKPACFKLSFLFFDIKTSLFEEFFVLMEYLFVLRLASTLLLTFVTYFVLIILTHNMY